MATTVPFAALLPPKNNPRRAYDKKAIEGLAQSIKKDGVLQNLIVRPEGKGTHRVVAGKRRYLALKLLNDRGEIDRAYRVPIRLSGKASAADLDRIATVENVQREPLDPIDEAEAFAKLLIRGAALEDVSAETGVSIPVIRRRVALAGLAPEVKEAVRAKALPLSLAEVFTLAPQGEQQGLLKEVKRLGRIDARQLREHILHEKPSIAIALFPIETYAGTFTKDLFAEKETTYFDDRDQFLMLQKQAVDAKAEELRKTFAWVEVSTEHTVSWWQYREAKKKEAQGAIIHCSPSGRVEIRKGLVKHEVDPKVTTPDRPKTPKERPAYSKPTIRYANAHKTLAMQMALMESPRKAKEATAILLLNGSPGAAISLKAHEGLRELAKRPGSSNAYELVDTCARKLLQKLGLRKQVGEESPSWAAIHRAGTDWTTVLSGIRSLNGIELDALIALLVILCFGTERMEEAEPERTFFSNLAKDLTLDMRKVWTPDEVFLTGLRHDELAKIAADCGALRKHPNLGVASKRELVTGLVAYFTRTANHHAALDEYEVQGRAWLPEIMRLTSQAAANAEAKT